MTTVPPSTEAMRSPRLPRTALFDSPPAEAFDHLTRLAARVLKVPVARVSLLDQNRQFLKNGLGLPECWSSSQETPLSHFFCRHVVASGKSLLVSNAREHPLARDHAAGEDSGVVAYAGMPLITADGGNLGSFCVIDIQPRPWTEEEMAILQDLAASVMTEIELRYDLRERRQTATALATALERETRISEALQRSLLRSIPEEFFPHLTVSSFYEAAWDEAAVGGDFFDAFALSDHRVALVVGDVSGKGLEAAARTAELKYGLRVLLREYPYPARALSRLNRIFCEAQTLDYGDSDDTYVTMMLAVLNTDTGELLVSRAGAEPPLLVRAQSGLSEQIGIPGRPLGVFPDEEYEVEKLMMNVSDTLIITTDGITEARRDIELFGYPRFQAVAEQAAKAPAPQAGQRILDAARAFAGGTLNDDICLLLARRQ